MNPLSEESLLLAKNWETYQALQQTEHQLRTEIAAFLAALEADLTKQKWWKNDWSFVAYDPTEIYISNQNWVSQYEEYVVSIGVEGFTAERIFGMESAPQLYVRSSDYQLGEILTEKLQEASQKLPGELDYSASRYLVVQPLSKVLPEEVEKFDKLLRSPIVKFFSDSANILWKFNDLIENAVS